METRKVPAWILEYRANCIHLFHEGIGNNDPAIRVTLWAAYNGITEYVDHWRARGEDMLPLPSPLHGVGRMSLSA